MAGLVVTLALVPGLLAACGAPAATTTEPTATTGTTPTPQPTATVRPAQPTQTAQIGQMVRVESTWEMALVNFRSFTPSNRTPPAGKKYVAMEVNVRNISTRPQHLANTGQFVLKGTDGTTYPQVYVGGISEDLAEMCDPNEQHHGVIAYEVPDTASHFTASFAKTTVQPHVEYVQWPVHL